MISKLLSIIFLLSVIFAATALSASEMRSEGICASVNETLIKKHLDIPTVSIVSKKKVTDNICETVLSIDNEYIAAYVSENYVIIGEFFRNHTHVTKETVSELYAKEFAFYKSDLDDIVFTSYKPPKADAYIYFISDPECNYCEQAKTAIKDFAEQNNIEVRVVLLPLPMHPGSREKAVKAYCSKMSYSDYIENKYPEQLCEEGRNKVERSFVIAEKLRLNGTPTFISSAGLIVVGFSPEGLKEIL